MLKTTELKTAVSYYADPKLLVFIGMSVVLCFSVLYYYLRYQLNMVNFLPILLYSVAYAMIALMLFHIIIYRAEFIYNKLDLLIFIFLLNNLLFIPVSFYRFGNTEGLYAIKNYLTPLLLYFVFIMFVDARRSKAILKLIAICCAIVSIIYIVEFINIRYAPLKPISEYSNLDGPAFKYSVLMNQDSLQKFPEGHGVSWSWRQSEKSTFIRMPGPLGHSNATGFIIAIGAIIAFALIVFTKGDFWYKVPLFLISIIGLVVGCSRINMAGAGLGFLIISIAGIRSKFIQWK